jgi:tetratricopeptide (TPR) repeat protein
MYEGSMVLIPEWHPPAAYFMPSMAGRLTAHHVVCGLFPYLLLAIIGAIIIAGMLRHRWRGFVRRTDAGLVAFAGLMALMAANTSRFIYLDVLAVAALALAYRRHIEIAVAPMGTRVLLLLVVSGLAGISFQKSIVRDRDGLANALQLLPVDLEPSTFPVEASDSISAMGLQGRILQFTSWGGYLIGRHWPDCSVFSDGRGNFTADERDVIIQTHKPYEREEALEDAYRKFPFDIVVLPTPVFPLQTWDRTRWTLVHRDDDAEVFLRVSETNAANLERARSWWRNIGIDVPDDVEGAERSYLRVVSELRLRRHAIAEALEKAATRSRSDDPAVSADGMFKGALILFEAGSYPLAAKFFRKALEKGPRHTTCALYLAWSLFLSGKADDAREALAAIAGIAQAEQARDFGPLKYGGRKILELLAQNLGETAIEVPRNSTSPDP